jgi:hypothetical protein
MMRPLTKVLNAEFEQLGFPLLWRVLHRRDAALTRGSTKDDVVVKVYKKKKSSSCDVFYPHLLACFSLIGSSCVTFLFVACYAYLK